MFRRALLLLGALIWAIPARADFFDDVGFALNKLGHSVEKGVDNVFRKDDSEPASPAQPASSSAAGQNQEIHWNQPAPSLATGSVTPGETPPVPRQRPSSATSGPYQIRGQVDDAPAPHAAPTRKPVQMVASLAPLPGYSEAPALSTRTTYSPATAAARLDSAPSPEPVTPTIRLPAAKPIPPASTGSGSLMPAFVVPTATTPPALPDINTAPASAAPASRKFTLRVGTRSISLSDDLLQKSNPAPSPESKSALERIARQIKTQNGMRIKLESSAIAQNDRLGEARRRSFERAQLVQSWLEAAGIRSTQIDLDILGAGPSDVIKLSAYRAD